jgi:hypothetical protein
MSVSVSAGNITDRFTAWEAALGITAQDDPGHTVPSSMPRMKADLWIVEYRADPRGDNPTKLDFKDPNRYDSGVACTTFEQDVEEKCKMGFAVRSYKLSMGKNAKWADRMRSIHDRMNTGSSTFGKLRTVEAERCVSYDYAADANLWTSQNCKCPSPVLEVTGAYTLIVHFAVHKKHPDIRIAAKPTT